MEPVIITPDTRYRSKLYVNIIIIALMVMLSILPIAIPMSLSGEGEGARIYALIVTVMDVLWLIPALIVVAPYYRSLRYEIHEDEVIVYAGIITKSVKHVPFRTVTNIEIKRGPVDRLFSIGTLNIQTAGMSGQSGVEEKLVGLPNYQAIYEQVAATLRRFRGGMSPTQAGLEAPLVEGDVLASLLEEVRAIRRQLEQD